MDRRSIAPSEAPTRQHVLRFPATPGAGVAASWMKGTEMDFNSMRKRQATAFAV